MKSEILQGRQFITHRDREKDETGGMSFFGTKKEKDDEDVGDNAATGSSFASSSSSSSSSAREASSSSWFGVDMSSMQSALQAGIADFQEALHEQVEEVIIDLCVSLNLPSIYNCLHN